MWRLAGGALLVGGLVAVSGAAVPTAPVWDWDLSAGFDSYLHTYTLATTDTTETMSEYMVRAGLGGRSARTARHRWRVRAEASLGTELLRQQLYGEYRLVDDTRIDRLHLTTRAWGRQYRPSTTYSHSSDNLEGRLDLRGTPWANRAVRLDLRAWGGLLDFRTPSALEADRRDRGVGAAVRSAPAAALVWGLGGRAGHSAYPDSAVIDRDTWSVEGDLDHQGADGLGLRLYHRSERRRVRDQTVRPSAWTHWTDGSAALPVGTGRVTLDLQLEGWRYDAVSDVYINSLRIEGAAGYRWGDPLAANWQVALVGERLAAGDSPESYRQFGLRGGVESYAAQVSGSLTLEYGRRLYDQGAVDLDAASVDLALLETAILYTDFNYWKIWLMASWRMSDHFDLDLMANYEPESHTERTDDIALGFASLRLRWRP